MLSGQQKVGELTVDSGTLGVILGVIGLVFSIVGWFDPVARFSNWWAKTSTRRAERRIVALERDLALARRFSQSPQLLIVFLLRLLFITLGLLPVMIIGVVITQTSSSPLSRSITTVMGISAYILILFVVTMATRIARRFTDFQEYEAYTTTSITQLRAKLPQPPKQPRTRRRRP